MKYNFDEIIPRRGTNSYKWDSAPEADMLPMWVADMDFRTAPAVQEALRQRVDHGIFGYTHVPQAYFDATVNWFQRRHNWTIKKDWILYTSGVVPALSAIIKSLTTPGDRVVLQTPVYNCFFSSIRNNGCEAVFNPLVREGATYRIDFEDLERKVSGPCVRLMLLCNPHNPVGRVWKQEELERIGDICLRNGVTVISDEIHCELTYPGHDYTPFASISKEFRQHSVTCISPTKAFNLAGLQIANIIADNAEWKKMIDKAININEVCDVNPFGVAATIAAYNNGEEWLDELRTYLYDNFRYMRDFCRKQMPQFPITDLEGTYLVWMDCSVLGKTSGELEELLKEKARLWLNAGSMYGSGREGFMRWNIACPRAVLAEGLKRFLDFAQNFA